MSFGAMVAKMKNPYKNQPLATRKTFCNFSFLILHLYSTLKQNIQCITT